MNAVMISIKPRWCGLIARGAKTIEVRKTRPNLNTPFKCYIYCTKGKKNDPHELLEIHDSNGKIHKANGKIIGEFICNKIDRIQKRGFQNNFDYCYLSLNVFGNDDIEIEITDIKKSCIRKEELNSYGSNLKVLYGWHISSLLIYDKPKELSEFTKLRKTKFGYETVRCECPPQSWSYVEELEDNK